MAGFAGGELIVPPPGRLRDPGEVVAAGYVGVRPASRPDWLGAYGREPFLDLASDLLPVGPAATWACSDADRDLEALGVPADARHEARAWIDAADRRGDLLYPNVWRRPHHVVEFAERFVPEGLAVLGVALAADQVDGFLAEHTAEIGQGDGVGIVVLLRERRPLAPGFRTLGYEPVSVHFGGLNCSWSCNRLQEPVATATGVEPNEWGFIDTAEEAEAVMAFLAEPAVGKEPGVWRAWLVVRYDAGS